MNWRSERANRLDFGYWRNILLKLTSSRILRFRNKLLRDRSLVVEWLNLLKNAPIYTIFSQWKLAQFEQAMRIDYFIFWPISECLLKKSNQSDCFPLQGGKWSDWLRVICFVFKTVVPKHRFCKLQNVWNVCEFGSDYMAPWVNIIDSLNMTLSYIGAIYS